LVLQKMFGDVFCQIKMACLVHNPLTLLGG
jgi:hypothetical protein